ncbi:site-specific integrase [Afipia carboxidovorans]|uniref:tyrosine-type recombinase/integrase n=1 Tax=Afipia carboxidovorans TaxID=40137 RepID=UPI00308A6713|nr:site-specific integrase [Afipia carboxidovorans]
MPLKLYKRGGVWHYRGTVAGRRLRGSCKTTSKDTAAEVAAKVESREFECRLHGPQAVLTFAQAAMHYRAAGKPTRFLERIEDHWKDTLVRSINSGLIQQSAKTLYPGCCAATWNRHVIVPTQAIINHAAEMNLCAPIKVKRFKIETKVKTPATLEWVEAFMSKAKPHLGALALFMFLTGARISEALAVQWQDVDLKKRQVKIRQTKIGAERYAHLPPSLVVVLGNLERVKNRPVFWYTKRGNMLLAWRTACKRAGIEVLSSHSCRHGFATALLQASIDPVTVAKLGGWKTSRHVFETYGHANDDPTLTDRIAGTKLARGSIQKGRSARKTRAS